MTKGIVTIKSGREKSIVRQHPWIFSGAIERAKGAVPGELVTVVDVKGKFLARGYWNPKSQIQVRILTWVDEPIDKAWWRKMLTRAIEARLESLDNETWRKNLATRLVNAENDFLPGLIVDIYASWLVIQCLTLFIDKHKTMLIQIFADIPKPRGIYERSDVDVRKKEGLELVTGLRWGEEPPQYIEWWTGETYLVDIRNGHKTGFYLDQSDSQLELMLAAMSVGNVRHCHILNLFSYTGAFGIAAARDESGKSENDEENTTLRITNVDSSKDALNLGRKMVEVNQFNNEDFEFIEADCFDYLHNAVKEGKQFDVVVCDPPKFAHNAGQVDKAARGYKDLNLNAFKIIKPGGYLMTFSCSGAISRDLFQKIVFGALADSGRQAQIVNHLSASSDHPVALTFPEGEYLKGLLLRVY